MAPLQFGTLVFDYQAIDVFGPTDLLHSASKSYMQATASIRKVEEDTIIRAPEFVFHHIGVTLDPVSLESSSISILPTTTVDQCPELDILLLGGPNSEIDLRPKLRDLVRRHVAAGKRLFTTCTGAAVAASTGVLDGKTATVNHATIPLMKKMYPRVSWTDEKKWIIDGNIWTAGGAVAGMDMFSHWLKESFGFDVLVQGAYLLDYEPRNVDGVLDVIPKRYDENGKQICTHVFT
ncbi:hypothetical protein FOXG_04625 [Fusarium oxysporum f. sp. lycopersici 4287]|uniref:DJ-1/PfpI domain-containing protein n=3 Tax=Fusarium oxysporum TaxID=5507 RepID=A0A0J9USW4_FUSO4|nr:hypothetical protein FOXG_04625 [Fusarium oxysporum f. sp. lycopersici 4287]EXK43532.1 hypothetical protein FOMG_02477 [Fusarium oxysporum f. sp. melonis 26406]KAJ9427786.1 class I glutamine amidotransferase-like protein [Fusarium oxysporum]KNB01361.1 hypothetical protein FOXG_04625 [Fusarium oxysporum f. sp. lycopersici 4287]